MLLSGMKNGKKKERNGKVYVGCWIDKDVEKSAQKKAKEQRRTFSSFVELSLAYHTQSV